MRAGHEWEARRRNAETNVSLEEMRAHNARHVEKYDQWSMPRAGDPSPPPMLNGKSHHDLIAALSQREELGDDQKAKLAALVQEYTEAGFMKRVVAICNEPPDDSDRSPTANLRRRNGPIGRRLVDRAIASI